MINLLEFVIRMKDQASEGLRNVRDKINGLDDAGKKSKAGTEALAEGMKAAVGPAHALAAALARVMGTIGLIFMVWQAGKIIMETMAKWSGWDPALQVAANKKLLEQQEKTNDVIAKFEDEEKDRLEKINDEYERQIKDLDAIAKKEEAIAAARQKSAQAQQSQRMTQIDADERLALSKGYDPSAVKLMYTDERRRAQADAGISDAQAQVDAADRAVENAQRQSDAALARSMEFQSRINAAETEKVALSKRLSELNGMALDEKDRSVKERAILIADRKADRAIELAQKGMKGSSEGEALASDAVEIAKAQAAAARSEMDTAMQARSKAEFDYQADVKEFWDDRDADDRDAQQAQLDAMRAQQEERRKLQEAADKELHAQRIEDIKNEVSLGEQAENAARERLSQAQAVASQAWGWYRDPKSFKRQLEEEKANAQAEQQFQKDAQSLMRSTNWRERSLGDNQESVRRVVLAREEERAAAENLAAIASNTSGLKEMLQTLLTAK